MVPPNDTGRRFINCACGPIIDDQAPADALNEGRIAFSNTRAYPDGHPENFCPLP